MQVAKSIATLHKAHTGGLICTATKQMTSTLCLAQRLPDSTLLAWLATKILLRSVWGIWAALDIVAGGAFSRVDIGFDIGSIIKGPTKLRIEDPCPFSLPVISTIAHMLLSAYHTILYYTILYYTILYYTILYYTILYYTILYYTILYYTILYYTILYYTILYTILYYTLLYSTILYCSRYWE